MFKLTLYDRKGIELKLGDIVKISNRKVCDFFARVTWLEQEKVIAPFHTFSFHSFEKVDNVPAAAVKSTETRYDIWYLHSDDKLDDEASENFEGYLMSWRECESQLNNRSWRIELIN